MLKLIIVFCLILAPVPKFKPVDNDILIDYVEKGYTVRLTVYDMEHRPGSYEILLGKEIICSSTISDNTFHYYAFEVFELTDVLKSGKIKRDDKINIKSDGIWYYSGYTIQVLDYFEPNTYRLVWEKEYK